MSTPEPFPTDWQRALCIVAHPDDLEYGTAAAVAAWTEQGKAVSYLLVTRGEAGIDTMHPDEAAGVREQEERDGAREVGVERVDFLEGYHDGVLENGLGLRYWTNDIIDPDEVATFGADIKGGANSFSSYWGDEATSKAINDARSETDEAKRAELVAHYREAFSTPYVAAARGQVDAIIEPGETRRYIARALEQLAGKRELRPAKKHGLIPL